MELFHCTLESQFNDAEADSTIFALHCCMHHGTFGPLYSCRNPRCWVVEDGYKQTLNSVVAASIS